MATDLMISNFAKFKKSLITYVGEEFTENLIESLGGEDSLINASFATNEDSGLAYAGSLCRACLDIAAYAVKINDLLPEEKRVDKASIVKVALLSQIAKVVMFCPNDNEWEVKKLGRVYGFTELEGALRCGERSILLCLNAGAKFTPIEFEAMRIMDKQVGEDNYSKLFSSTLSILIKSANEIITSISK